MSSCGPLISQEMHPTWKEMPINNRNNDIHHCCRRDSPILEIVVPCSTKHSARRSGMMSRAFACTHAHGGSCPYNTVVQKVNVRVPLSNKPAREGQVSRPGWHGEDVQGYLWYVRWQVSASITAHTANDLRQPANGPATPPDNKQPLLFSREGMPAWRPGVSPSSTNHEGSAGQADLEQTDDCSQVAPNTPRCSTDGLIVVS